MQKKNKNNNNNKKENKLPHIEVLGSVVLLCKINMKRQQKLTFLSKRERPLNLLRTMKKDRRRMVKDRKRVR